MRRFGTKRLLVLTLALALGSWLVAAIAQTPGGAAAAVDPVEGRADTGELEGFVFSHSSNDYEWSESSGELTDRSLGSTENAYLWENSL